MHIRVYAPEKLPYAIDAFLRETARLYEVLDERLREREFICGNEYTIADMASYPWIVPHKRQQQNLDDFPQVKRWFAAIRARPGTQRAYALADSSAGPREISDEMRKVLFEQGRAH